MSGENAPICVSPLGLHSERIENDFPTPTFPCEGPRPTVETLGGPAEVFDERNAVFHLLLLLPQCGAEHGGVSQELGQTWRLLTRYQQLVRDRYFAVSFHRIGQNLLGRVRLVPRVERQPRERSRCSQGYT